MELAIAEWLTSAAAAPALAEAAAQADPTSLAAASELRRHHRPEHAAAALGQVALRRRAVTKFGTAAAELFFTGEGLEQATRSEVATWRAQRFVEAGVREVVDLGCGLAADARAFAAAGLAVRAVDADPATAVLAQANLGSPVRCADAIDVAASLLDDGVAVFLDPARRTAAGRTWRVSDFSPPWDFAAGLLDGRFGCIKGAPGLPFELIPPGAGVSWVSDHHDLVETTIWSSGQRQAVLLPGEDSLPAGAERIPVGEVGRFLYEPDPAVIRSGAIGSLAAVLGARRPSEGIAYLFADQHTATVFAQAFEVLATLPYDEKVLRSWVRDQQIGVLEIKCRGVDVDPAVLRRRLKLRGRAAATLVLTPTPDGVRALVARRLSGSESVASL